jgi:glycosyltransferase involved in cell wall biosynthesis
MAAKIRMLFFPAEAFPTNRVRLTLLFGRELLGRGHEIDFVMQAKDGTVSAGRHEWGGRSVWVGATDSRDGFAYRVRKHVLAFFHEVGWLWRARTCGYDCILVSDKFLIGAVAIIVARVRGLKCFFWLTFAFHKSHVILGKEKLVRYPVLSVIRGYVERFLLHQWIVPFSDHVFVQSPHMAGDFCRHGADPSKLTPVMTGIDLGEIEPVDHDAAYSRRGQITVGYLGTLARERRLEVLVEMLAALRARGLAARLLLVGDGEVPEDRRSIERRATELGVDEHIEITGYLPRSMALDRIKCADICVSPIHPSPIFDGASPTKLVEYMALGLPVVANAHPDQSLVLRESRAGIRVPWGARHFARAVYWLSRRSDEEISAFGLRGRAWVESHRSYAGIADEFERACMLSIRVGRD